MAIKKISEFTAGIPTDNDYILFEQNGAGKSAKISDLGINMDLLWTNASPTSLFDSQTVNLDLSGYSYIRLLIICDGSSGNRTVCAWDLPIGVDYRITANFAQFNRRRIVINNTYIRFHDCESIITYGSGNTNISNYNCIPYQIYGVK